MSWRDEGWQQAARDYQAGRKHGRHQRITQMDFEPETPGAEIIQLGNQRDEARPPAFSDDALALRFIDQQRIRCAMSPAWASGSDGMASVGVSTTD
jgi:hypothetical protein